VLAAFIWSGLRRESETSAAARLDIAAGLRERISSGLYCMNESDPFAQAVVADAQRASGSVAVRQHIRLNIPQQFAFTMGSFVLASLMFLITPGLLKSDKAVVAAEQSAEREQAQIAVKREMERVQQFAEANPALQDLSEELKKLDPNEGAKLQKPDMIRHEALKKIDRLEDAVKQKRDDEKYEAVPEMKKMLRGLRIPESEQAPTEKLSKALAKGDFKEAKEEVAKLKEQLATLKAEEDKQLVEKMSKQLEDLAKQLEQLAKDDKLAEKLEQAGVKKEDVERMLERLSKADLEQLKKQLEKSGLNQQQIDSLAKQLQQRQQAGSMAKKMSQGMQKAAQAAAAGQTGQAMEGMQNAGDQLSELEQMEQEMNQLDSAMADLQQSRDNLGNPCGKCGGKGCSGCNGGGQGQAGQGGMGKLGQGRGNLAPEEKTAVDFKIERQKVKMGKGAIVGQFLIDGEQVRGEVGESLGEVVTAAEREASDLIHRDRVPRQYHKAIKEYFSNLQKDVGGKPSPEPDATKEAGTDSDPEAKDDSGGTP
jgi:chemotaxis protein histidine kinase CheA